MSNSVGTREVVDPEVRAYVYSLISAIGGTGTDESGHYELGDDALACLKDLKRWLKLYDEKTDRLDVARCMAEANLVSGDLLQILAAWPEDATENRAQSKIALACLELLVPLTWPIEKTELQMKVNHHRHMPYLQLAQVRYKQAILDHDSTYFLRAAVRTALPSLAQSLQDRTNRDEAIIRLVLYFLRNIAIITPPQNLHYEGNEAEVSRSATIKAFDKQDILHLILTISSGIGEDFNNQDVVLMEVLFHLLKGIDVTALFADENDDAEDGSKELRDLLKKEAGMHRGYLRNAPTRHNRFGTMIWVKRDDARVSTVSGQHALMDDLRSVTKIDQSKRFKKPAARKPKQPETKQTLFDSHTTLDQTAKKVLQRFVEEFLDSAFNPLFSHIRKAIEREADRVLDIHTCHYFYLVAWFLEAHRMLLKKKTSALKGATQESDPDSYTVVASVLNYEMSITLNKSMDRDFDSGDWNSLHAGMRCFTQILLTIQDMGESLFEDDQDIAENLQNNLFYEESTHDRIVGLVRTYKNQGFTYLDSVTELAHVHLRMLERYSKQNIDLQIKSKRAMRKKKPPKTQNGADDADANLDSDAEEEEQIKRTFRERRFDFTRFAAKFINQNCVDTYVAFAQYYKDLTPTQLKRAHRYFYRVAFKMESPIILFRMDIIALFNRIVNGPESIDTANPVYKEWREFVRQIDKKLTRKLDERPELVVELLFSKSVQTVHFLDHGYHKEKIVAIPKPPALLQVDASKTTAEGIAIVVSHLVDQNKNDALTWLHIVLDSAAKERQLWENEAAARQLLEAEANGGKALETPEEASKAPTILVKPDNDERKTAMFKDAHLRLLMTLCGMRRVGLEEDPDASWTLSSSLSSQDIQESLDVIKKAEFSPPTFEDGQSAADFIRRKPLPKIGADFDDDDDGEASIHSDEDDLDLLFPKGGPTARKKSDALKELKKKCRARKSNGKELTEEDREEKAKARREADLARQRKIKSDVFIHDSDDEDDADKDEAFFELEEQRRKKQRQNVLDALQAGAVANNGGGTKAKRKADRKRPTEGETPSPKRIRSSLGVLSSDDSSRDEDLTTAGASASTHTRSDSPSNEEDGEADTPVSSPGPLPTIGSPQKQVPFSSLATGATSELSEMMIEENELANDKENDMDGIDSTAKTIPRTVRRRAVVSDSSDEE